MTNAKAERALDLAIQYGRLETVQLFLRSVARLSVVRVGDPSALHLAARSGHRAVVEALLGVGFNINHKVRHD